MYEYHLWNTSMPRTMTQGCLWHPGSAGLTGTKGRYLSVFVIFVKSARQNKIWARQSCLRNARAIFITLVLLQNQKIQQESHIYIFHTYFLFYFFVNTNQTFMIHWFVEQQRVRTVIILAQLVRLNSGSFPFPKMFDIKQVIQQTFTQRHSVVQTPF